MNEPAEQRLARMIAEAAQGASSDPAAAARAADQVAELVIELGAQGDAAFARFFDALGRELKARGAHLPPIDQLPAAVAPLIAIFQGAFAIDPSGELDAEATADRFDAALRQTLGTSPRALREQELRDEIRRDAAASVAATMREHGLVPAGDLPDDHKPPRDA